MKIKLAATPKFTNNGHTLRESASRTGNRQELSPHWSPKREVPNQRTDFVVTRHEAAQHEGATAHGDTPQKLAVTELPAWGTLTTSETRSAASRATLSYCDRDTKLSTYSVCINGDIGGTATKSVNRFAAEMPDTLAAMCSCTHWHMFEA